MNANELRIGNLVGIGENALHADGGKNQIYEISELKTDVVQFKMFHSSEYYKDLAPIPLTEEILLKLGFEKKSGSEFKNERFIYRFKQRDLIIEGFEYDYNGILCYPEFVHQLQNIYFALTGEELQLK